MKKKECRRCGAPLEDKSNYITSWTLQDANKCVNCGTINYLEDQP